MSDITLTKFDDFYMVDITGWNTSGIYMNGELLNVGVTGKRFTVKDRPRFARKNSVVRVTHWVNVDDPDVTLSIQEYQTRLDELSDYEFDEDDDHYQFDSLEAEFAYRKFKASWKQVHVTHDTLVEMDVIERHGMLQGEDFIEPMFCYDSSKPDLMIYNRVSNIMHHLDEMSKKHDLEWQRETHSGIYYWKLNGRYVFTNNETFKLKSEKSTGTLEQCRAMRDADAKLIRSTLYGAITPAHQLADIMIHDLRLKVSSVMDKIGASQNTRTARERNNELDVAKKLCRELIECFNNIDTK